MIGVFTTGTDTDVGKTWVGTRLISALLEHNIEIIPRKPIESGWNDNDISKTDAWKLAKAANKLSHIDEICPNRFSRAISPARAAQIEGYSISTQHLVEQCLHTINKQDFLYVEGAGGFYSPLTNDGLNSDLARALNLPVILIAENRLGCINQVLLNVEAINKTGLPLISIVLNQPPSTKDQDITESKSNLTDILSFVDCPVIPIKYQEDNKASFKLLAELILKSNSKITF